MSDGFDAHADEEAERMLLAACLDSKAARQEARRHITAGDLWVPAHETVWRVMSALDRAGTDVNAVTVRDAVRAAVAAERSSGDKNLEAVTASYLQRVVELVGIGMPESVASFAGVVRDKATRRRMADAGRQITQRANNPAVDPTGLASQAITILTGIRDSSSSEDVTALTLGELMALPDDEPEWVIPDLLERGDRLMLTGSEGAGKSALSRQLGMMAAAGMHPFTRTVIPPIRACYIDCENKEAQVRRQARPLVHWLHAQGAESPMSRVMIDNAGWIDITRDRDLNRVLMLIDAARPDLVVIGPLYRMTERSLNDEEVAAKVVRALDLICDRGAAVIVEAHAGHSTSGDRQKVRDLRPRGSSSLMGWPEFGLGLRGVPGTPRADLEPWRGGREHRAWPTSMVRAPGNRWEECEPDDRYAAREQQPPVPPDPEQRLWA